MPLSLQQTTLPMIPCLWEIKVMRLPWVSKIAQWLLALRRRHRKEFMIQQAYHSLKKRLPNYHNQLAMNLKCHHTLRGSLATKLNPPMLARYLYLVVVSAIKRVCKPSLLRAFQQALSLVIYPIPMNQRSLNPPMIKILVTSQYPQPQWMFAEKALVMRLTNLKVNQLPLAIKLTNKLSLLSLIEKSHPLMILILSHKLLMLHRLFKLPTDLQKLTTSTQEV